MIYLSRLNNRHISKNKVDFIMKVILFHFFLGFHNLDNFEMYSLGYFVEFTLIWVCLIFLVTHHKVKFMSLGEEYHSALSLHHIRARNVTWVSTGSVNLDCLVKWYGLIIYCKLEPFMTYLLVLRAVTVSFWWTFDFPCNYGAVLFFADYCLV